MSFGTQLKTIRKGRGLRQKDVADALGVAQTTIANYEQGIRFPDLPTLNALVDFFGVSMDYLLGRTDDETPPERPAPRGERISLSTDANHFMNLLLRVGTERAESFVVDLMDGGTTLAGVYLRIIEPALREVGRLWETGELDVGEEHLFSEAVQDIMSRIAAPVRKRQGRPTFVGLSAGGELHRIGIRMVADLFAAEGWEAVYLGGDLPAASIVRALGEHDADVLGISATMPYHTNGVQAVIDAVGAAHLAKPVRIIVGGRAFAQEPDLWKSLGAHGYAPDAAEAVAAAKSLIDEPRG